MFSLLFVLSKLKFHQRSDVIDVQNITTLRPLCPISFLFQISKKLLNKQSGDLRCSYDNTAIRYMIIKLVPIITHSNITWLNTTMTIIIEHGLKFELTKDISYLTLMGKPWLDILQRIDDNIRRLCGTRLSCNTSSLWHDSLELFGWLFQNFIKKNSLYCNFEYMAANKYLNMYISLMYHFVWYFCRNIPWTIVLFFN